MTRTVNIYEAKTHLSALVESAAGGEEIIIAKAGKPRAKLVPVPDKRPLRKPGCWKGQVWMADDFNDPMPEGFWDGPIFPPPRKKKR